MFRFADSLLEPGNELNPNEDQIGYGGNYCFAIDGASSLSGVNVMEKSDARWFVQRIAGALTAAFKNGPDVDVPGVLTRAIEEARALYNEKLEKLHAHEPGDSPSCGIALFWQVGDMLHFFGLGDCVGVLALPEGKRFCSLDTSLPNLDNGVLEEMIRIHKQTGVSMQEARKQCNHILLKNREMRNHPEGYYVLDLSGVGIEKARRASFPVTGDIRACCFSDGFAQLAELFGFYEGYAGLLDAMEQESLQTMYRKLYEAQEKDADCNNYPRFKLRDDTCAVYGTFTK